MIDGNKKLENKKFWVVLGAILLLSFSTMILFSQNNLTGQTIQNIAFIQEGGELFMEGNGGLKDLTAHFSEEVKNAKITIKTPTEKTWELEGVELERFTVSFTDNDKISSVDLTGKVEEEKISISGLSKEEVKFYLNGKELATTLEKIERGYVYYKSSSKSIGEFVIGKKEVKIEPQIIQKPKVEQQKVPEIQQPSPIVVEPEQPGFFSKIGNFFKNLFN